MGIYHMSCVGCHAWYEREITDVLHIPSGSLAIEDGKRIYNLDYRTEVLPQLLSVSRSSLVRSLTHSLFKIVWNHLLLNKCTRQRYSHILKEPVSEGETGKCGEESNLKDLGTPVPGLATSIQPSIVWHPKWAHIGVARTFGLPNAQTGSGTFGSVALSV